MADELISRAQARARGLKKYFTGKPCKHGHICQRDTQGANCSRCLIDRRSTPYQLERHRRNMKISRVKNPEKYKKIANRSIAKYRERDLEKNRAYHRAYQIEWNKNNLEKKRSLCREWRRDNPEAARATKSRRRSKELSAPGSHTADDLKDILRLQKRKCAFCRVKFDNVVKPSLDHIKALSRGGSNDRSNIQFLCRPCNSRKSNRDHIDFSRSQGMLL